MKSLHKLIAVAAMACCSIGLALSAFAGPQTPKESATDEGVDAARLWAQTCQRCHNLRPATAFSDAQLQVIVHHMEVRANLTGKEAREILSFLKDAN